MADYEIHAETSENDEGSTFATITIRDEGGIWRHHFASYFDDASESATVQAASFVRAYEESREFTLEERLGPFGLEWEREQMERGR